MIALQSYRAAQHFDRVSTNTDVGDEVPFARSSNKNFTGPSDFDTLSDQHALVRLCNSMSHHPTGSAASGRTGSRVFATAKKHAGARFKLSLSASFEQAFQFV
jgi:hypothetical protein